MYKKMIARGTKVLAMGTFDILHPGHVFYLKQAKKLASELHVIVACDASVCRIKGKMPFFSEKERVKQLQQFSFLHKVYLGKKENFLSLPKKVQPDIFAFGYDQSAPFALLREEFPFSHFVCIIPHFSRSFKSSHFRGMLTGES